MKTTYLALIGITLALGASLAGCPFTPTPTPPPPPPSPTSTLNCQECHADIHAKWSNSKHGDTQSDVAGELADERAGETPDETLHGADAENCIACHGPTAINANGGMSETQALAFFFSTAAGAFTADTSPTNTADWPSVACTVCHEVPANHPDADATRALFDSRTAEYVSVDSASELCGQCHGDLRFPDTDHRSYNDWLASKHADTQADVAEELAAERAGETPDEVVSGDDPENCIACHAPTAVLANGGMTEAETLDYFFTSTGGAFDADTAPTHASEWASIACTACHDPMAPDTPAYFNSSTKRYETVASSAELCGQCHGDLRFADTDHLTYNAWLTSKHSDTQADVAEELAAERAGETPDEVVNGDDPENCIACHGPTAVLANDGMTEAEALDYFFTTTGGAFTAATAPTHNADWPSVTCTACHDPMAPDTPAYFNSETKEYDAVADSAELCGQCHGNLRFPGTDHLSYNIETGTGGIGVPDQLTMPGVSCTDCHMLVSDEDGSNSSMFHGHTFAITVAEAGGASTTSCTNCHEMIDTELADAIIGAWQASFAARHALASDNVAAAATAMEGVDDAALQAKLDEAQFNLFFAESDESGGVHNRKYTRALLNDANEKALEILSALGQ